ncbi:hypothetical protein DL771_008590 [Monosporascus sp. 5C6A]|nr:hypothetical protein DL771_008590 [Monosporascus sp. 5C6A]
MMGMALSKYRVGANNLGLGADEGRDNSNFLIATPTAQDYEPLSSRDIDRAMNWGLHVGTHPELNEFAFNFDYWRPVIGEPGGDLSLAGEALPSGGPLLNAQIASSSIVTSGMRSISFRVPVRQGGALDALTGTNLSPSQQTFKDVRYLAIGEKSMVDLGLMGMISDRLIEAESAESAKSSAALDCSGWVRILLRVDFNQLPPVFDKPVYYTKVLGSSALAQLQQAGRMAYMGALKAARSMPCTRERWELLGTRYHGNLSAEEIVAFSDVVRVHSTNARIDRYSFEHVDELGCPILPVKATGTGDGWDRPSSRAAGSLDIFIPVSVGARVMLLENICVSWSTINGALGTVEDIVWKRGVD